MKGSKVAGTPACWWCHEVLPSYPVLGSEWFASDRNFPIETVGLRVCGPNCKRRHQTSSSNDCWQRDSRRRAFVAKRG